MRKGVLLPPTISIPEGEPMRSRSVNTPTATYHAEASGAAAQAGGAAGGGASSSGAAGGGEPSWADAMQRSQALSTTPERAVRPGDVIEHPKFGRCDVMRVDDGEERISVRIPAGRLVELGLEVLQLELVRTVGTKQFYKVHMSRR